MNPRERLLLTIIAVLAVIGAGLGARRLYVDRSEKLERDLKYEQNKLRDAQKKLAAAEAMEIEWKATAKQTIAADAMVAKGRLREELIRLARESGFPVPPTTVDLISALNVGRNGLVVVVYQIKAEGTAEQIVSFLHQLYRQPYLVRCKSINLKPIVNKAGAPGTPPQPTGRLTMSLSLETPILPSDKKVPKFDTAVLAPDKRAPVGRTQLAMAEDYKAIKKELFERFVPKPPVVVAPPPPPPPVRTQPSAPPPPPPPPPPPDANLILARILSSPQTQQVVLEHPTDKSSPDKRVEVGDPLYGGVLIFVHQTGAVSEKEDKDGKKRTFHPIRLPLNQGQVLSMTEHPAVYDALTKLEERLAGINRPENTASP